MTGAAMAESSKGDGGLAPFKELILLTCGFILEQGREQTLLQGLRTRMARRGVASLPAYHALVLRDRAELAQLVELLTVNETYFFREPDHLNLVADKLLAEILAEREQRPVRIVSAGCSTGEEPYTVAMMLRDRYGADCERLFSITGVDIDGSAVASARRGVYGKGSFRGLDPGALQRHFSPAGPGEYRVGDEVRKLVSFEVVNLLSPCYPDGMRLCDVIFYRNVSIYFPAEVQRKIFSNLAELLNEGGYLVVGATETLHHDIGVLSLVQREALFCYRKSPVRLAFAERRSERRTPPAPVSRAAASTAREWSGRTKVEPLPRPASPTREVKGLFDTALGLACAGKEEEALELLDRVIEGDPGFGKALTLKGSLLVNGARFDEAASVCRKIVACDPLCPEGYLMLGVIARYLGDEEEALKRFREAVYLDQACWLANFYSAEILLGRGEARRAKSGYEAALRTLRSVPPRERGTAFFPLTFNAEQFMVICRHKLSLF